MSIYAEKNGPEIEIYTDSDYVSPYDGGGMPGDDAKITVNFLVKNVAEDQKYTLHAELEYEETAWIIDPQDGTNHKNYYTSFQMTGPGKESFAVADSKAEMIGVRAHIVYASGAKGPEAETKLHFVEPYPDAINVQLNRDSAVADGVSPIVATATATKNGSPVQGVTIRFEIHEHDCSACFQPGDGITIEPGTNGKKASGETDGNGQRSISITDEVSEYALIVAYYDTSDSEDKPLDEKEFKFDWPDGLIVTPVGLSATTIDQDGVPAGTLVEWDGVSAVATGGESGIKVFACVTTKDGKPWTRGEVRFRIKGDNAKFTGTDPWFLEDHREAVVALGDDGRTPYLSVVCSTFESNKIVVELLSADSTEDDDPAAPVLLYRFDPWFKVNAASCEVGYVLQRWPDMPPTADPLYDARFTLWMTLASNNALPIPVETVDPSSVKILDYDEGVELGSGASVNWSYSVKRKGMPKILPVRPAGFSDDTNSASVAFYIYGSNYAPKRSCRIGAEITTGRNIVSTGILGSYGYPIGTTQPGETVRYWASGKHFDNSEPVTIKAEPDTGY